MSEIYERREDESAGWYERLRLWLFMGSHYSLVQVHEYASKLAEGMTEGYAETKPELALPSDLASWQKAAEEFGWQARVQAYEEAMREMSVANFPDSELLEPDLLGAEQVRMVATLLHQVNSALRRADLFALTRDEARAILPTLRLFFRDLFRLHQDALRMLANDGAEGVALSADDLMEALAKVGGVQQLLADLHRVIEPAASEAAWQPLRDILAQLYHDEASARRISDQAHLDGSRIHFASRALDRWHAILTEASHAGYIEELIAVALSEYPHNADLAKAVKSYRRALLPTVEPHAKKAARKPKPAAISKALTPKPQKEVGKSK